MQPQAQSSCTTTLFIATKGHVCCLSRSTGQILWDCSLALKGFATLLYADKLLFVTGDGYVACLSAHDGRLVWQTSLSISSPASISLDLSCPQGRLFLSDNGMVFALDATTGQRLWTNELKGMGYHHVSLRVPNTISAQPNWTVVSAGDNQTTYVLEDYQKDG